MDPAKGRSGITEERKALFSFCRAYRVVKVTGLGSMALMKCLFSPSPSPHLCHFSSFNLVWCLSLGPYKEEEAGVMCHTHLPLLEMLFVCFFRLLHCPKYMYHSLWSLQSTGVGGVCVMAGR